MVQEAQLIPSIANEIQQIHDTVYKTFKSGVCRPLEYRRAQLLQLARMLQENANAFAEAIHKDLGKPKQEVYGMEIGAIIERSLICADSLEEWSKPQEVKPAEWATSWSPKVLPSPKGPILIISPWNYPLVLSLQSLYAAMAAGCPAVVKPSEFAPAFSETLAHFVPKYLDPKAYAVVCGAVPETTKLLELRWAHIFYTGNGRVGRIVAAAAARHLTPVSLELGGKSPVIVAEDYDVKLAAKRILFGKCSNAGQTCVAPDYVLVAKSKRDALVEALAETLQGFYPTGDLNSDSLSHIVSRSHFDRINGALGKTKGKIARGGKSDPQTLKFEITIVSDVDFEDELMKDEIFGPILPIIGVDTMDEAVDYINSRDHPLTLYAFTDDAGLKQKLKDETLSGSLIFNDSLNQLAINETPFGGVGESGYGNQVLKYGFDGFTHFRTTMDVPKEAEPHIWFRYAPYSEESMKIMGAAVHLPIPAK